MGDQGLRQYLWPLVFSRELGHWFFRVKKQEGVDRNLTSIESRVEALVSKLEKHAQDFLGYTTGADSFAYFTPMLPGADIVELGLTNKSSYPVFDVRAEVIDLDEAIDPDKGKSGRAINSYLPAYTLVESFSVPTALISPVVSDCI